MSNLRQDFIAFALKTDVLMFGEYTTKAGRKSPYFFNAGRFNAGASLGQVARFYARTLIAAEQQYGTRYDMLFGPAYKGITLASATAVALADIPSSEGGRDLPFAYNRKEAKDHGEGGALVGAKLAGKVVIVDDVISAGTSVRESVHMIRAAGAEPAAVLIAMDRMERGGNAEQVSALSAVQEVTRDYGLPVIAIANLNDVMEYLLAAGGPNASGLSQHAAAIAAYRDRYGAAAV